MDRLPFPGFPFPWTRGAAVTAAATVCLGLGGCLGLGEEPPPTAPPPEKPMVAPTATPSSEDFNLKVATPQVNPPRPTLEPVPVLAPPPPPVTLEPLPTPEPVALAALPDIAAPQAPPQRGAPIPPPPGPPHDTVSGIEAPPTPAPGLVPAPAPEPRRSTASLPVGGGPGTAPAHPGSGTTPTVPAPSYRLVFAGQSPDLPDTAPALLRQLAALMTDAPQLRLKLNSFASGSADNPVAARRLSLQRAMALRQALVGFGVSSLRVDVLALGLTATEPPADRIDIVPAN